MSKDVQTQPLPTDPIELMEQVGRQLFGNQWQCTMANMLGVTDRQIRRYVARENRPSFDVPEAMVKVAVRVAQERRLESEEIAQYAQSLRSRFHLEGRA